MEGGAGELAEYRNGIRYSHIDRGDHVEIIMEGILMNAHGIIWAAGVSIPDELEEQAEVLLSGPPFVVKLPSFDCERGPVFDQLRAQFWKEACDKMDADMKKAMSRAGFPSEEKPRMSGNQSDRVEAPDTAI